MMMICKVDEHPALKNTCHDARFAPHVGANVNAGYIPPAARFPPHRSRPTGYPPNRQPATVGAEERGGRHDVESDDDGGGSRAQPAKNCVRW
jgi:hypothetical protein